MGDAYSAEDILAALEKSPAFVAVVRGPSYIYAFVNERYGTVVGFDDPIGKPFGDSRHPAVAGLRDALDRVYATGEPWAEPELRLDLRGPDGTPVTRWFDAHFVPLRHGDQVDGVLVHSYDVTALVRAREQAREHAALREKMQQIQKLESLGVLAGGLAHDFNNMLAIVLGSISAAATLVGSESPARPLLEAAKDGAVRAAELTRQLLTYAGKSRAEKRPVDLSAHVLDMAHLLGAALPKTVTLELDLTPDLARVEADPVQMQQVVMNLLINAGEAVGDAQGHVVVATGTEWLEPDTANVLGGEEMSPGEYAFVDVRDDGPGMDEETLPRIFDPFFSTKTKGASSRGLGLAAVVGIVRAHRGGIRVETAPGAGASFRVLLPRSPRAGRAPRERELDEWRGHGTVLVVDDDPGVREALAALLGLTGFDVLRAADGRSGLERVAENPELRLVVLDLTMPEMSGARVLEELRAMRPALPVLLVSGYSDALAGGRLEPPTRFLAKPFTMPELVHAVRSALGDAGASPRDP
jgi:two-component system cell cycle sensor histidine kinase/response regulator CckA